MSSRKTPINWKEIGQMLQAGCHGVECAAYIGIDPETLYNRCKDDNGIGFSEFIRQNRRKGNALLRVKQFEVALKDKDKTMLVWLGKQRLKQRDRFPEEEGQNQKVTVEIAYVKQNNTADNT